MSLAQADRVLSAAIADIGRRVGPGFGRFLNPVGGMSGRILHMDCSRALVMTQKADSADDRSLMAHGWCERR
jgi:hypothetical protein